MKKFFSNFPWLLLLVLAALAFSAGGCASTDPENVSSRPWNSPRGWESGLPGMMNEGH